MTPLEKVNSIRKRLQRENPKLSFRDAQVKAGEIYRSGRKVSGPKKKVSGTKKPQKKSIIRTQRITTIGARPKTTEGKYERGKKILATIKKMEAELKRTKGADERLFIKKMINREHDALDSLTKKRKAS